MSRAPRSPRRAYVAEGREIPPMTLANMRGHGLRSVAAERQEIGCGHAGSDPLGPLGVYPQRR